MVNKLINRLFLVTILFFCYSNTQASTFYNRFAASLRDAKNKLDKVLLSGNKEITVPYTRNITAAQASLLVQNIVNKAPKSRITADEYWKNNSVVLLRCTKVLYNEVHQQLLRVLQEIDKRLIYWQYQNEHQWQYFFSKNPLKWVTGKTQSEEIETNIEQLRAKQQELFILLGKLSVVDFNAYLIAFNDEKKAYAWIEAMLIMLATDKEEILSFSHSGNYGPLVMRLSHDLRKVNVFYQTTLSELVGTEMPYHIARNWVKYGLLLSGGYYAYNSPAVAEFIKSLPEKRQGMENSFYENIEVVKNLINETFFGGRSSQKKLSELIEDENGKSLLLHAETPQTVSIAVAEFLRGQNMKDEEINQHLAALDLRDPTLFANFFNEKVSNNLTGVTGPLSIPFAIRAGILYAQVLHMCTGSSLETAFIKILDQLDKESGGARNLALLAPAALGLGAGALGISKAYNWLSRYNYNSMRRSLIDISSLFVDQTKPLEDDEYGKMVYLLYNLKEKAKKELPTKDNIRSDFIKDLERVESRSFDVAAKRRIIKDMFKKYNFLGLVH